eukprot:763337-Hanusia_phi.AAC.5
MSREGRCALKLHCLLLPLSLSLPSSSSFPLTSSSSPAWIWSAARGGLIVPHCEMLPASS